MCLDARAEQLQAPLALRSPFLCACVPHLVSCAVVSVCGTAVPGNAAHGDTGWAGTGEPLCSALGCLLISSWTSLAWDTALTDVAQPGAWPEPWLQPCLGSALKQHPRVSSLQGCSWGKGAAGAPPPLPPLPPLPCEPHSPDPLLTGPPTSVHPG